MVQLESLISNDNLVSEQTFFCLKPKLGICMAVGQRRAVAVQ